MLCQRERSSIKGENDARRTEVGITVRKMDRETEVKLHMVNRPIFISSLRLLTMVAMPLVICPVSTSVASCCTISSPPLPSSHSGLYKHIYFLCQVCILKTLHLLFTPSVRELFLTEVGDYSLSPALWAQV